MEPQTTMLDSSGTALSPSLQAELRARIEGAQAGDISTLVAHLTTQISSSDLQEQVRKAAVSLTEAGRLDHAAILWGCLTHLHPNKVNFLQRTILSVTALPDCRNLFVECLPDLCLTQELWPSLGSVLGSLVRKSWTENDPARFDMFAVLLLRKCADLPMQVTLARTLRAQETAEMAKHWLSDRDALSRQDLIRLSDVFELAGHPGTAWTFFSCFAPEPSKLSFHTALLGGRIAAQVGAFDKLDIYKEICRSAVAENPRLAANSHIYHLLFHTSSDPVSFGNAVDSVAASLSEGRLQMAFLWRYFEAIAQRASGGEFLAMVSRKIDKPRLSRQLSLLGDVIDRTANTDDIILSCADGTWDDPETSARLISRVMGQIEESEDLIRALDLLGNMDSSTKTIIRDFSTDWRAAGQTKLAAHGWAALVRANPNDDWARINAAYCYQVAGDLDSARSLTKAWDLSNKTNPVLIHIATTFARVGLSDIALSLFEQAYEEAKQETLPQQHLIALMRGLILYGDMDRARSLFKPGPPRLPPPADTVILDPGHTDASAGHHVNYNIFFSDFVFETEDKRPEILIGRDRAGESLHGYNVYPAATFEPYVYDEFALGTKEFDGLNNSFHEELRILFSEHVPKTLIMHSMRAIMFKGLVAWLKELGSKCPRQLVIGLIEADHLADEDLAQTYSRSLSDPLSELSTLGIDNIVLFAETSAATNWLQGHVPGLAIHKFPYLAAGRAASAAVSPEAAKSRPPMFGILGATRQERGFNSLFRAILDSDANEQRWLIQFNETAAAKFGDDTTVLLSQIESRPSGSVSFLKRYLSLDEYLDAFAQLDCIVLPYSGRYAVSGSGVLYEAIYSRKYLVVSRGSTLAQEMAELGYPHHLIDPDDHEEIAHTVAKVEDSWTEIVDEITAFFATNPELPLERFRKLYKRSDTFAPRQPTSQEMSEEDRFPAKNPHTGKGPEKIPPASTLASVIVPCLESDLEALERCLTLWARPAFTPVVSAPLPALLVVFNNSSDQTLAKAADMFASMPELASSFSRFEVVNASLTGDMDLYARDTQETQGRYGNKAGPNFLFQKAMHAASRFGDYALQIELDCLPVRPGWVDETNAVLARNPDSWVIGSAYLGDVTLDQRVQFHLNGNAIYKAGDPAFRAFLDNIWIPRILAAIDENPNLAYDCWWAFEMSRANAMIKNDAWRLWQTYDPFFHNDPFLVNLTVGIDHVAQFFEIHDEIKARRAAPIFFHGKAIQTLIEKLQDAPPKKRLRQFVKEWTAGHPPANDGAAPARPAPLANAAPPPTMHLLKGFNNIEGPVERYGPTRFAWSKARKVEVLAENLNGPLSLRFRIEPKFGVDNPLPGLKVSQGGQVLPHKLRLSEDKAFGFLDIPGKQIVEGQPLLIETTTPIHKEPGPNARDLGILFFEDKMRFYPARAMAQAR